jgi:hypothetical protein
MAGEAWQENFPPQDDPNVYSDKQWAVFSQYPHYHQIIGDLSQGLFSILGFSTLLEYMDHKHNLSLVKLQKTNLTALQEYLLTLRPHNRETICKLIHNWIPTYSVLCRQGREPSPLCPHCCQAIETSDHIWNCPYAEAITSRHDFLQLFLKHLLSLHTPVYILTVYEYKLSLALKLPYSQQFYIMDQLPQTLYCTLIQAIRHQNTVGRDNFLRGYISSYWFSLYKQAHSNTSPKISLHHGTKSWYRLP